MINFFRKRKNELEVEFPLRGLNDKRIGYHIKPELIVDTIDRGLYGSVEPNLTIGTSRSRYHSNVQVWKDLIDLRIGEGSKIELHDFDLLEWLPENPGRFHNPEAEERRYYAKRYVSLTRREYLPLGKMEMVLGGIGSIRLMPRFIKGGEVCFFGASSNGVSHQGIPVIAPFYDCQDIIKSIRGFGGLKAKIKGSLWTLPYKNSPIVFDRGMPKYYLFAEHIDAYERSNPKNTLVSVAITYNSKYYEAKIETFDGRSITTDKNWSFASFNPSLGNRELTKAVNWLEKYVGRYDGDSILGDFDETKAHFDVPVEFDLKSILKGEYDPRLLKFYGSRLNITIKKEYIMGDKFENISNSTIINRSTVEKSFNSVRDKHGNDVADAIKKLTEIIAESGNQEAVELFNSFNEELTAPEPKKSLLRTLWNGIITALPSISSSIDIVEKIVKLF